MKVNICIMRRGLVSMSPPLSGSSLINFIALPSNNLSPAPKFQIEKLLVSHYRPPSSAMPPTPSPILPRTSRLVRLDPPRGRPAPACTRHNTRVRAVKRVVNRQQALRDPVLDIDGPVGGVLIKVATGRAVGPKTKDEALRGRQRALRGVGDGEPAHVEHARVDGRGVGSASGEGGEGEEGGFELHLFLDVCFGLG